MVVGSIYDDRKIGVENSEWMSLPWGHVEFEMPIRHPNGDIKLEEGSEIEILFWCLDIYMLLK